MLINHGILHCKFKGESLKHLLKHKDKYIYMYDMHIE